MKLKDYDYDLPSKRIAQYPPEKRDQSKLMVVEQKQIKHRKFYQIFDEIEEGDVLLVNNSKVIASKLKGKKETGGKLEGLFLREIDPEKNIWECLLKGRKLREGIKIEFLDGQLTGTIVKWKKFGQFLVEFSSTKPIKALLQEHATITLPPYIKAEQKDLTRYQTIYASIEGSIAAPTAGFHFTPELIQKIKAKGAKFVNITLHVGYSTFMPLTNEILSIHTMDPEYFSISSETLDVVQGCLDQKKQLIAVGTTTLKALESATDKIGNIKQLEGWSDLFVSPGYSFRSGITRLITNFHMPKSSPLLMVCAYAGKRRVFDAYQEAILKYYRFYSFGDAMFIDKE